MKYILIIDYSNTDTFFEIQVEESKLESYKDEPGDNGTIDYNLFLEDQGFNMSISQFAVYDHRPICIQKKIDKVDYEKVQLNEIILGDDETEEGGVFYQGETLEDFLYSIGFKVKDPSNITVNELYIINDRLSQSGITKLTPEDFFYGKQKTRNRS